MHRTIAVALAALVTSAASAETYRLYLLAGQSNMDGYGENDELPAGYEGDVEGVRIFLGQLRNDHTHATGVGLWTGLGPGFGVGAKTDGEEVRRSDRFGPELAFARRLRELRPHEHVAIIKYAKGGSSLDRRVRGGWGTWDPHDDESPAGPHGIRGVNQYDHALATIRTATGVQDIDGDGEPDTLIPAGIVWMQGETDAKHAGAAADYADNLAEFAELLRAALRADDLPFVIGRITDRSDNTGHGEPVWRYLDTVRAAQEMVAAEDPHAALVTSTDGYQYSDAFHYDSAGYLDLGERFAESVVKLRNGG